MKYTLVIALILLLEGCASSQRQNENMSPSSSEAYPYDIPECGLNLESKELYEPKSKVEYFYDSVKEYNLAYSENLKSYQRCVEQEKSYPSSDFLSRLRKKLECLKLKNNIRPSIKYIRSKKGDGDHQYYMALNSYIENNIAPIYSENEVKLILNLSLTRRGEIYRLGVSESSGDINFDYQAVKSICLMEGFPKQEEFLGNHYDVVDTYLMLEFKLKN